jgi:hypothetical protein
LKAWNELELTNFAGTNQIGSTVTWTGRATTPYRYLMPFTTHLSGATNRSSTFTVGGLKTRINTTFVSVGQISETDTAQTITVSGAAISVGQAAETDLAQSITSIVPVVVSVGQATETNLAQIITPFQLGVYAISQVTETDLAQTITPYNSLIIVAIGQVTESDLAQVIAAISSSVLKRISVEFFDLTTGAPKSGLVPKLRVRRSDGLSYDHSDIAFKAASACSILAGTMTENDPTYYPGTYEYFLVVGSWGSGADTVYQLFIADTTNGYYTDPETLIYRDGVEQWGGMTLAQNTNLATVVTATDTLEASTAALPTAAENAAAILAAANITPISATVPVSNGVLTVGQFLALK